MTLEKRVSKCLELDEVIITKQDVQKQVNVFLIFLIEHAFDQKSSK